MKNSFDICSPSVSKGLQYLYNKIKNNKEFSFHDALSIYLLSKFDEDLLKDYVNSAKEDNFWEDVDTYIYEQQEELYYLTLFEFPKNMKEFSQVIEKIKINQNKQGKLALNDEEHSWHLLTFLNIEPESDTTKEAIIYLTENWKEIYSEMRYYSDYIGLAASILALSETNYFEYEPIIKEMALKIISFQNEEGFFGDKKDLEESSFFILEPTAMVIWALSRVRGIDNTPLQKAVSWLKSQQINNGSWKYYTELCLLALFEMGEGPKISIQSLEWENKLQLQKLNYKKPIFVKTIPPIDPRLGSKELQKKILSMIKSAKKDIRILSLYFDMMYEDVIDFCEENKEVSVKIITRPKKDITGLREKIATNVINILNIATRGNVRQNEFLHTRLIIVDGREMIVSSADLTREQLVDEFNAGIYLRDPDAIKAATDFFEKIWENSNKIPQ